MCLFIYHFLITKYATSVVIFSSREYLAMVDKEELPKFATQVTVAIFVSRIFGYFRDVATAYAFGTNVLADAFYMAYRIPNLFRRIFGEGTLSAAYVPVLTEVLRKRGQSEAQKLFLDVFTIMSFILVGLTVIGIIFAQQLVPLIAYGYQFEKDYQKLNLTVNLTRIVFPYLLVICLSALQMATLQALEVFFLPNLAPVLLSLAEILYLFTIFHITKYKIEGLAVAVVVGGIGQLLLQFFILQRKGWKSTINFNIFRYGVHPGVKKIFLLMLPAVGSFSVEQVNTFVDALCASFLPTGSVTALYYSNRILQLPLALFGTATAIASLPVFSQHATENDYNKLKNELTLSLRISYLMIIPATVGLLFFSEDIIKVLFFRGAFDEHSVELTSKALFYYSVGLFGYTGAKITATAFYAMQDIKTPVKVAFLCLSLNIALNLILMELLGVGGLALASSISSICNFLMLLLLLRLRVKMNLGITNIIKSTAAFAVVSTILVLTVSKSLRFIGIENEYLFVALLCLLTAGGYFAVLYIFGNNEVLHYVNIVKAKFSKK